MLRRIPLVLLASLLVLSCDLSEAPGRFAIHFDWEDGPPANLSELWAFVRVESRTALTSPGSPVGKSGDAIKLSEASEIPVSSIPYEDHLVVVAEIKATSDRLSGDVLYWGQSEFFSLRAGQDKTVDVLVRLRPRPSIPEGGALAVAEAVQPGSLVPSNLVTLTFPAEGASEAIAANDSAFSLGLDTFLLPVGGSGDHRWSGWDLDRDVPSQEDGPRTVYLKLRNTAGYTSVAYSVTVQLDTVAPKISTSSASPPVANATADLTYSITLNEALAPDAECEATATHTGAGDTVALGAGTLDEERRSAVWTLDPADFADGQYEVSIAQLCDRVGHCDDGGGSGVTTKADGSLLAGFEVDSQKPRFTVPPKMTSDEVQGKAGQVVVTFSVSEDIQPPVAQIDNAGTLLDLTCGEQADREYRCTYAVRADTVPESEREAELSSPIQVRIEDLAGNAGELGTAGPVLFDFTAPTLSYSAVETSACSRHQATNSGAWCARVGRWAPGRRPRITPSMSR